MSWFHSSKLKLKSQNPSALSILLSAVLVTLASGATVLAQLGLGDAAIQNPGGTKTAEEKSGSSSQISSTIKHVLSTKTTKPGNASSPPTPTMGPLPPPLTGNNSAPAFNHTNIITTVFWIGEGASGDNGNISNSASTWDEKWESRFGGTDSPDNRNGYHPKGFTPKENPFYVALPYSDITDTGERKPSANRCPLYSSAKSSPYSWCKNSWVAVRFGEKIAYGQWEDAGPFGEDDLGYVFGGLRPSNKEGMKAGLDVSPALRDYLGLSGVDKCDWAFVSSGLVSEGPWKQIVTSSPGTNSVE